MVTFEQSPAGVRMAADAGVIDAIVQAERMISTLTAAKLQLIEFAHVTQVGLAPHALAEREFRAELATALRISERGATMLTDEADVLVNHLPATFEALATGLVTPRQARVLIDELGGLEADDRDAIEQKALSAAEQSAAAFRRAIRRLRETREPAEAIDRHRRAVETRSVTCDPAPDGMGWVAAHLPAAEAIAIDSRLDDLARGLKREGDERTMQQLRADAFADVMLDRDSRAFRRFGEARPTVVVTVPVSVLAGSDEMAHLSGFGPVDAVTARELVAEAPVLRRLLTDPRDDAIVALGRTRYRVTDDLRLLLAVRDEHCRFPNCPRHAVAADVDHSTAWADGGSTDADNLAHLCRSHHTLKHGERWRIEARHPDGTIDWVSPTGRRHRSLPARATAPPGPALSG